MGAGEESVRDAINMADLERMAAARLDAGRLAYFAGGTADEVTLRDNVEGYRRWRLRPRVAVDVGEVSTGVEVVGQPAASPVAVAPVAFQRLVDPGGEAAMARAAGAQGSIMCLSTLATARPAEVAREAPGTSLWLQLYAFRDRGVTRALVEEAVDSGFGAIAVTLDAPRAGRRERDVRAGFRLPPGTGVPSLEQAVGRSEGLDVQEIFARVDPTFTWDDLAELVEQSPVPVIAKGVMTAEDADLAFRAGAAGVGVSNHGGRQLDCVPATVDVLPEVVDAVEGRGAVLIDGGIRRGTDVAIALALGADAVMAGRPALWGLAAGGEEGAGRALQLLREELELALTLLGCRSPAELTRSHVRPAR